MNSEERAATLKTLQLYEARRAKLEILISALREDLGLPALGEIILEQAPDRSARAEHPALFVPSPYAGMSAVAAAEAYLRDTNRPQSTKQIASGIKRGGYETHSKSFTNTMYARLYMAAKKGETVEWLADKQQWALREWRRPRAVSQAHA